MTLNEADFEHLLQLRTGLRRFLRWSEEQSKAAGLTPAKHQLLLAIRGHPDPAGPTIGEIADYLVLRHHSAVGLIDRTVRDGLVSAIPTRTAAASCASPSPRTGSPSWPGLPRPISRNSRTSRRQCERCGGRSSERTGTRRTPPHAPCRRPSRASSRSAGSSLRKGPLDRRRRPGRGSDRGRPRRRAAHVPQSGRRRWRQRPAGTCRLRYRPTAALRAPQKWTARPHVAQQEDRRGMGTVRHGPRPRG